jgi:hypothetical protein
VLWLCDEEYFWPLDDLLLYFVEACELILALSTWYIGMPLRDREKPPMKDMRGRSFQQHAQPGERTSSAM